jgi:hypothetical protein
LDRFLNTQFRLLRLGDHWTFTPSHSLHNATPTRHRDIRAITHIRAPQAPQARMFPRLMHDIHATLASSAVHCHHEFTSLHALEVTLSLAYRIRALPLFKRECSRASRAYVALSTRLDMSPSHHQQSIVMRSLRPYILLMSHNRSILRSRTSAFQARMFPRFARLCRLIHAHRHITLASLQSSPCHSGNHHHHISKLTLCLHAPESLRASATLPHFHAPMTPYACAFPALNAPLLRQSHPITFASYTLA